MLTFLAFLPCKQRQSRVPELSLVQILCALRGRLRALNAADLWRAQKVVDCEASLAHKHFQILRSTVCDCCSLPGVQRRGLEFVSSMIKIGFQLLHWEIYLHRGKIVTNTYISINLSFFEKVKTKQLKNGCWFFQTQLANCITKMVPQIEKAEI